MTLARGPWIAALLLLPGCASAPRAEQAWRSIELAAGSHGLDESSWEPLDSRVAVGLSWSARKPEWPCGIEAGIQYARAESQDDLVASGADFLDLRAGACGRWRASEWLDLVCGAGPRLGFVQVREPGTFMPQDESGTSFGLYAHAGAFVRVHGGFAVGLDAQWADGSDYDVLGAGRSASTAELLLALRWDF